LLDLDSFNAAPATELTQSLLACADVPTWAETLVRQRPYRDVDTLLATADSAAREFRAAEVDKALAAHPRIGERSEGTGTEAGWSRQEQSGVADEESTQQALFRGNQAYEERFGRVFLICASGLSGEQILAALRERLENDSETESAVVATELRKIALLRLRRLLDPQEEHA